MMNRFTTTSFWKLLAAASAAGIAFSVGVFYGRARTVSNSTPTESSSSYESVIDKASEVMELIDKYYIGDVDNTALGDGVAEGLIAGTGDRWSHYISAAEFDAYMEDMNNAYVGVGITIKQLEETDDGFTVAEVTAGGPAEQAGVKTGDVLLQVEGESVLELGMEETRNRVRGPEGSEVHMTFRQADGEHELTIRRASIAVVNVTQELLDDGIGYVHIRNFDANCAEDTIAAIESLQKQGAEKFIFDVRFNPGGLKNELVKLLDYLLPEGPLFISEEYDGTESTDRSDAKCVNFEMAVLVNGDSYSAAEFFAAALHEYEVATVVGTQTCGKGYFQTTISLSDGSAIALSVGKYRTPKGVSLAEVGGLTPDQVVEVTDEQYADIYYQRLSHDQDPQLQAAIAALQK